MRQSGFSIASIFLLMTVVSVLLAGLQGARFEGWMLIYLIHPAALTGMVIGAVVGVGQPRPVLGCFFGGMSGWISGVITVLVVNFCSVLSLLTIAAGGPLLLAFGGGVRWASHRREQQESERDAVEPS